MMNRLVFTIIVLVVVLGCSRERSTVSADEGKEGVTKMNIDLQWGGYYAVRGEGEEQFRVFRLLDFNRYSYHIAIYEETFARVPSLEEVVQLSPYVGHAPFDSRVLLREGEIHLLGGPPLAEADLQGYRLYLEHSEVEEKDIEELFGNIIGFGNEAPVAVTLTLKDGELEVTER